MNEHTEQSAPTAGADCIETSCHATAARRIGWPKYTGPANTYMQWVRLKALLAWSGIPKDEIPRRLRERAELGRERYGQYLAPGNGRDARRDLQEELLDAAAYMAQVEAEGAQ